MSEIRIWRTLTGAVILTPQAIGFGYFKTEEMGPALEALEAGASLNQVVGFSGSVYPLHRLRRVYLQEKSKRVVIQYKELVLHEKDDFNFHTHQACMEFYDALMGLLGPDFIRRSNRAGCGTLLIGLGTLLIALFFLSVTSLAIFATPKPGATPPDWGVFATMGGIGLAFFTIGVFCLRRYFQR